MSKTIYEVSVINGTYINKNKEKKNRYQQIGAVIDTKNGPMLKLDSTPLVEGGWNGWAYLNTPKPKEDYQGLPKDEDIDF
jgi:hypothetical protein